MAKTDFAAQFRIAPGKRAQLAVAIPPMRPRLPRPQAAEAKAKQDAKAIDRLAGQAVRGGQARACWWCCRAPTPPARTAPSARVFNDDWAARRHGHALPPPERGGAGARFPVARAPRRPAPRHHRHLQPLALRGRAGGARARKLAPPEAIEARYEQINDFEQMLTENGTTILKFMLHISKEEQGKRLQERLDEPDSRWKFNPGDLDDRKLWDEYQAAYEIMLNRCSTALGALARDPRRPQVGAQRGHGGDRARDAGGDEPAVSQARLGPQRFQGGLNGESARMPLHDRPPARFSDLGLTGTAELIGGTRAHGATRGLWAASRCWPRR